MHMNSKLFAILLLTVLLGCSRKEPVSLARLLSSEKQTPIIALDSILSPEVFRRKTKELWASQADLEFELRGYRIPVYLGSDTFFMDGRLDRYGAVSMMIRQFRKVYVTNEFIAIDGLKFIGGYREDTVMCDSFVSQKLQQNSDVDWHFYCDKRLRSENLNKVLCVLYRARLHLVIEYMESEGWTLDALTQEQKAMLTKQYPVQLIFAQQHAQSVPERE